MADGDHAVFSFRRCIIANGIDLGAVRGDLALRWLEPALPRLRQLLGAKSTQVRDQVVEVGPVSKGLRVIEKGLKANDRVIVNGLQRVRPGMVVDPKPGEMPRAQNIASNGR